MEGSELTCEEFIDGIKAGDPEKKEILVRKFYQQYFAFVITLSNQFKLRQEDVLSIYNEAVALLVYKIENNTFSLITERACSNYVYQIVKNQCISLKNSEQRNIDISQDVFTKLERQLPIVNDWDKELLHKCLDQLGETCKQVLILWAMGYRMNEIVEAVPSISNENSASVTKFECLKKLKDLYATYSKNTPNKSSGN